MASSSFFFRNCHIFFIWSLISWFSARRDSTSPCLSDGGLPRVVLEGPACHGGLARGACDCDDVRVEGAVVQGCDGEVPDVVGDDVVVVDEAPPAGDGATEDAEAGGLSGGRVCPGVGQARFQSFIHFT